MNVEPRAPVCRSPSVRGEEEQLVLDDRPAKAVAELVLVELRHRRFEDVLRRELVALEVVRAAAAELVRAGLRDHLNLRARTPAVHGREVVGDDANLFDRFGVGREIGDAAARDAVRARVVHGVVVGLVTLAARVHARRRFAGERVVRAAAAADRRGNALAGHTRLQGDQVVEIAPAERHFLQLQPIHAAGNAALLGLDEGRGARDRDAFLHARHFERDVEAHRFADADHHVLALGGDEALLGDLHPIGAGTEAGNPEDAFRRRRRFTRDAAGGVGDDDDGAGDDRLLRVGDGALNRAAELSGDNGGCESASVGSRKSRSSEDLVMRSPPRCVEAYEIASTRPLYRGVMRRSTRGMRLWRHQSIAARFRTREIAAHNPSRATTRAALHNPSRRYDPSRGPQSSRRMRPHPTVGATTA